MTAKRLSLGCGNFGGVGSAPGFFGQGTTEDDARAIMDIAWNRGIRWFDTADAYGGGRSESFIGRWRADRGRGPIVTTKVFYSVTGDPADHGLSRDRILRNVEGSLERLGVDRLDLYLAHDRDLETPLAETVGAFEELVRQGTIGAWGLSNHDAAAIREALAYGRPALIQNAYSLLDRDDEAEVLPFCAEHGLDYVPFGPLAGGWLTGKYRRGEAFPEGSRMTQRPEGYAHLVTDRVYDGLDRLAAEAHERGVELTALAFAWVLSHPGVAGAVCGPTRPAHLEPVLAALELPLSADERDRIGSFFS
ncbi:MAG TPA: aldo/keto reductase [Gaiellaceae bacterium]|nr:aldo/keto reductase [Gaiellaceae bacterium]